MLAWPRPPALAVAGWALLVFPKMEPDQRNRDAERERHGHIGIVTRVDAGRATEVIHCSAENWLAAEPPSDRRNAIAKTDTARFDQRTRDLPERGTLAVWCNELSG